MRRPDIARLAQDTILRFQAETGSNCFDGSGGVARHLEGIAAMLGLQVVEDPTLEAPNLGELNAGLGRISVRPGLDSAIRAFTVAHEIGHAVCHPGQVRSDTEETINEEVGLTESDGGVFQGYDESSRQELEANVFAAELLAPTWKVRDLVHGDPKWSVDALVTALGVSRSALVSQLSAAFLPGDWKEPADQAEYVEPPLDPKQAEAVEVQTPALVLAGPGAGKTRILVERFVHLVGKGTSPESILALTFSNKAAGEMLDRISSKLSTGSQGLSVSTFHSFGLEVLKLYGQHLGLVAHPKLLPAAELYAFLRDNLGKLPLGCFEDIRRPTRNLRILITAVSRAKDELVSPEHYSDLAKDWVVKAGGASEDEQKNARRSADFAKFYAAYEELLKDSGVADFGDLIRFTVQLLETEGVGDEIRSKYGHILVDETQDINFATLEMLRLLDGGRGVIWAVGDPRQSIYRFRGASSISLLQFPNVFPGTTIVELDNNYRSNTDIVSFSQAFDFPRRQAGDDLPIPKLKSGLAADPQTPAILLCEAPSEPAELAWIAAFIAEQANKGTHLEDFAVLCRTRAQAQKVADALSQAKVPNNWAGSLDKRDAFKDVMAALYLAADNTLALTRLWTGTEADLRALMRGRKELKTRSVSRLLYEAADGKVEGLSESGVQRCVELKRLAGTLGALDSAGQVVERYIFDLCEWTRALIAAAPNSGLAARSTLGQTLGMAKSFSKANPGPRSKARGFLRFVSTAQEAAELRELGLSPQAGVVNVATIHASKGLEWPHVIIPYAAKSKLPPPRRAPEYVHPPGVINGEDPSDVEIELACLVYVALTRPKQSLTLTYASHYGKPTKSGSQNAGLSPLISPAMLSAPAVRGISRFEAQDIVEVEPNVPPSMGHSFDGPIPYSALKAFVKCPKRFELQHILEMHDTERGYLDFQSSVTETVEWLIAEHQEGREVSDAQACAKFEGLWGSKQQEHWYHDRFVESGRRIVVKELDAVKRGKAEGRQHVALVLGEKAVRLTVDSMEQTPTGLLITKVNHGPPAKSHRDDEEQRLLSHVAVSQGSARPPQINYPLYDDIVEVDTTPKKIANTLEKVAETADEMLSGPYLPKPDYMNCRGCFAALICPANPEDEDE